MWSESVSLQNHLCALGTDIIEEISFYKNRVTDSCTGDSGGGLTAKNSKQQEVLLGIVSFGNTDCGLQDGEPGVYTNVLSHVEWIQEQMSVGVEVRLKP